MKLSPTTRASRQPFKAGEFWEGIAYRAPSGNWPHSGSAADIIWYEQEELGNQLDISNEKLKEVERRAATDVLWVARTKKDAQHYGRPEQLRIPVGTQVFRPTDVAVT